MDDWTRAYVGIPFRCGGRTHQGADCWGLVALVYEEQLGIRLPTFDHDYESTTDAVAIRQLHDSELADWMSVDGHQRRKFDVVWAAIAGHECHTLIYLGDGKVLHCMEGRGTCIERLGLRWSARIRAYYRHRQLVS